jgi:hypothetical protein
MTLAIRRAVSRSRRRASKKGAEGGDRRTGYYVAGRDWPAISNDLSVSDIYTALEKIDDEDVAAATSSLRREGSLVAVKEAEERPSSG